MNTPRATFISAKITIPGLHRWPTAHDSRAYLRDMHRHLFHVTVIIPVSHNERDVEFHDLAEMVRRLILQDIATDFRDGLAHFGERSCETLAEQLGGLLQEFHNITPHRITWSEDGEFAAELRY